MNEAEKITLADIKRTAKEDAVSFVEEFREPFRSDQSDWDATAYGMIGGRTKEPKFHAKAWPLYVKTLEAETRRIIARDLKEAQKASRKRVKELHR
jgi:hypothetical protein